MTIDGIRIDLDAILSIRYECRPELCRNMKSCCANYEVCLGAREISKVTGMMPHVVEYVNHLGDVDDYENPFDKVERNLYAIDTDDDGLCLFAYRGDDGCTWCSIHSAALDIGIDMASVKPKSCVLWPLALSEGSNPVLSVQSDALDFPCNQKSPSTELDPEIEAIVSSVFGEKFLKKLQKAISKRSK